MRVVVTVLVTSFGAVLGAGAAIACSYWLLSGSDADAFTWLATGLFFCFVGMPFGAALAFIALWRFGKSSVLGG